MGPLDWIGWALCAQQKGPCLDLIMEEGSRILLVHRIKMIIHVSDDINVLRYDDVMICNVIIFRSFIFSSV